MSSHQRRKMIIIILKEQILGQFGEIGFKKINKKKHVTPLGGLLRATNQGNKADH